jgi:hypothetical protein
MMAGSIHTHNDGPLSPNAAVAILIDSAGMARQLAAEYRSDAKARSSKANQCLANAARKIDDARWYLRRAHDRNAERSAS